MSSPPGRLSGPEGHRGEVEVRALETLEELQACVALQERVWGAGFAERAPASLLRVACRLGGVVAGAFDASGAMVGFVFGLTGLEDGEPVHWSDMLAVRPDIRDGGLGTALKRFQRERCMERGVTRMYWTFDPLEARNAWVNFGKLGGVAREYVRDMYGSSDSPLHRGLGTDRLVVTWELGAPRVAARLEGAEGPPSPGDVAGLPRAFEVDPSGFRPRAGGVGGRSRWEGGVLVPVPKRIQDVKARDPEAARAWRGGVRTALEEGLAAGLEVKELIRGTGDVSWLLLQPAVRAVSAPRLREVP